MPHLVLCHQQTLGRPPTQELVRVDAVVVEGELAAAVRPGAPPGQVQVQVPLELTRSDGGGAVYVLRVAALVNLDCEVPLCEVPTCSLAFALPILVFGCWQ